MKKFFVLTTIFVALLFSGLMYADNPQTVTINAVVADRLTLIFSHTAINFPDADPDTVTSIPNTEGPVTVDARARAAGGHTVRLSVDAPTNLFNGSESIGINNVSWTATGDFVAGTMGAGPVTVGSWTNSGNRTGTLSFLLANSWTYATGIYTTTVTYTLAIL
jgi:hypothetical protein